MKDMVTNGTGNSRYLKTSLASGTTWESALAMLREGTFPIDLNGLNNGGITQLGSAYSKANVLPDDVCALLGLNSTTAEPKDAFGVVGNPAELWVWEKHEAQAATYELTTLSQKYIYNYGSYGSANYVQYQYADSISVSDDGTVTLVSPKLVNVYKTSSTDGTGYASLYGKYFKAKGTTIGTGEGNSNNLYSDTDGIYFWPNGVSADPSSSSKLIKVTGLKKVNGVSSREATRRQPTFYISSPDENAYPEDGQSGDYLYIRLGQIGEGMTKIETGSYVGTGTYGSSKPNVFTFPFAPKLFSIYGIGGSSIALLEQDYQFRDARNVIFPPQSQLTTTYVANKAPCMNYSNEGYGKRSADGKTIYWYHNSSAQHQLNESGTKYYYFAIG